MGRVGHTVPRDFGYTPKSVTKADMAHVAEGPTAVILTTRTRSPATLRAPNGAPA